MEFTIVELLMVLGVPSIITLITLGVFNKISDKRKSHIDTDILMKKALQALLRNELREQYVRFINQGWVDIDDKSNFSNMYDIYHSLGKNGVMDEMCKQVLELSTQPPITEEYKRRKTD